jgi:hypothetical protein
LIGTRVGVPDGAREPVGVLGADGVAATFDVGAAAVDGALAGGLGGVAWVANDGRMTGAV